MLLIFMILFSIWYHEWKEKNMNLINPNILVEETRVFFSVSYMYFKSIELTKTWYKFRLVLHFYRNYMKVTSFFSLRIYNKNEVNFFWSFSFTKTSKEFLFFLINCHHDDNWTNKRRKSLDSFTTSKNPFVQLWFCYVEWRMLFHLIFNI